MKAPSYFQAFINGLFRDVLNCFVVVYLDNILIYSKSYSEHIHHVRQVLSHLLVHGLYVKAEKCEFHKKELLFFSYRIGSSGVNMVESKVTAVTSWPEPTTVKELQRFLGFANFYLQSFSSVALPLTDFLKGCQNASRIRRTQAQIYERTYVQNARSRKTLFH